MDIIIVLVGAIVFSFALFIRFTNEHLERQRLQERAEAITYLLDAYDRPRSPSGSGLWWVMGFVLVAVLLMILQL